MCEIFLTQYYGMTFFAAGLSGLLFYVLRYIGYSPFSSVDLDAPKNPQFLELIMFIVLGFITGILSVIFIRLAKLTATLFRRIERGFSRGSEKKITSLDFPNLPPASKPHVSKKKDSGSSNLSVYESMDGSTSEPLNDSSAYSSSPTSPSRSFLPEENIQIRNRNARRNGCMSHVKSFFVSVVSHLGEYWKRYAIVLCVTLITSLLSIPVGTLQFNNIGSPQLFMNMMRTNKDVFDVFEGSWGFHENVNILIIFLIKYFILPISIQLPVPAGIVMPSLVTGALFGRLFGNILYSWSPEYFPNASLFGACGAAAFLAATTHTLSPAIIVMEATGLPNSSFPCLLGVLVAYFVSTRMGNSLFTMLLKFRRIPYISPILPKSVQSEEQTLGTLMQTDRFFVTPRTTVRTLRKQRDLANSLNANFVPLVKSEINPILIGGVTVQSLSYVIDNPILLEKVILESLRSDSMLDSQFISENCQKRGKRPPLSIGKDYSMLLKLYKSNESKGETVYPLGIPPLNTLSSSLSTSSLSLISSSNPASFYLKLRKYGSSGGLPYSSFVSEPGINDSSSSLSSSSFSSSSSSSPPGLSSGVITTPIEKSSSSLQILDDYDLSEVFMLEERFVIDSSPFNLSVDTPLVKAHSLFHLLSLNFCIVTNEGKYVGIVFKSDFLNLFAKELE
jgi:hypothetical protein